MKVPLLDLKAQHEPIHCQIIEAIESVLRSQQFILSSEVERLEERIADYCQSNYAIGVSSGTDALLVSLMALGIGPGDEVITPAYSFFATAGTTARLGATPVFVDIDPLTYNIDPSQIERAITQNTKAIIPVHLYGQCADMDPILELARKHQLSVVEDAAQAIGAQYADGQRAGSMGTLGCFSFFPSKNLGALGDAGMVVTNDPGLAEKIRCLRSHGAKPKYYHRIIGGNFRLDAIQAAVLNVKLDYLDRWTALRQENAKKYKALFEQAGLIDDDLVSLPDPIYMHLGITHYHIYNQFVVRVRNRDDVRQSLKNSGIATEVYYPVPFHLQECFSGLGHKPGDFLESERAAHETLALPVYPEITDAMLANVAKAFTDYYCQ